VPLHARLKGEPALVPIHERDLDPDRVRLGIRRTTARDDYLPRSVRTIPPRDPSQEFLPPSGAFPEPDVTVLSGDLQIGKIVRTSRSLAISCMARVPSRIALRLHDFAGWQVFLSGAASSSGERVLLSHTSDDEGRIVIDLPAGSHTVKARLERTLPRLAGDLISLAGVGILGGVAAAALLQRRKPRLNHSIQAAAERS
jgi:hypothetical protein